MCDCKNNYERLLTYSLYRLEELKEEYKHAKDDCEKQIIKSDIIYMNMCVKGYKENLKRIKNERNKKTEKRFNGQKS